MSKIKKEKKFEKSVDKNGVLCYNQERRIDGSIAQLGEHLPYKQGVTGSSPVVPTIQYGPVVQLVRTLACHARGRRFEPDPGRQQFKLSRPLSLKYASVAQSVEQGTENPRVVGSIPTGGTILRA